MKDFWKALFEPNERTCFATTVYDTNIDEVGRGHLKNEQYFCINPLTGLRRDDNVAVFRNILLEFDTGTREEQSKKIAYIPYTTLVWSGGKSHHAIISLETPPATRAEYDEIVRRIHARVPEADHSTKNPSRLSRTPFCRQRPEQKLLDVKSRISGLVLHAWLGPAPIELKTEQPTRKSLGISVWTRYFLKYGSNPGQRNSDLFKAACDMLRHGYTQEEVQELAGEVLDLPYYEIKACVASAAAAVRRGD